jgi:hypothetical protein
MHMYLYMKLRELVFTKSIKRIPSRINKVSNVVYGRCNEKAERPKLVFLRRYFNIVPAVGMFFPPSMMFFVGQNETSVASYLHV